MGGPGSGNRWGRGPTKRCAEACPSLDTAYLRRHGWLRPGARAAGELSWKSTWDPTPKVARVVADPTDPAAGVLRVSYTLGGERLAYGIRLDVTRPHYGGVRWWLRCPLVTDGVPCPRRARKLYRAGRYFGCRGCHRLTYYSRQQHDNRVSRLLKHPGLIEELLANGIGGASPVVLMAALKLAGR